MQRAHPAYCSDHKENNMKLRKLYETLYNKIFSVRFFKKILEKLPFLEKVLSWEVVSYLVFGGLTTLVNFVTCWLVNLIPGAFDPPADYKTYVLFTVGSLPVLWTYLTNTLGWTAAVVFAFVTNKLFVFESRERSAAALTREIVSFVGARVLSLLLFELLLFALLQRVTGGFWLPKILSAAANIIFNYFASKLVIFRKRNKPEETPEGGDGE